MPGPIPSCDGMPYVYPKGADQNPAANPNHIEPQPKPYSQTLTLANPKQPYWALDLSLITIPIFSPPPNPNF